MPQKGVASFLRLFPFSSEKVLLLHVLCYNVIKTGLRARYEQRKGDFDELHNLRLPRAVLPLCLSWMAAGNYGIGGTKETHRKSRLLKRSAVRHLRNHSRCHDTLPVRTAFQSGLSVPRLYDHRHRRRMDRRPRPGAHRPRQMVGLFQ